LFSSKLLVFQNGFSWCSSDGRFRLKFKIVGRNHSVAESDLEVVRVDTQGRNDGPEPEELVVDRLEAEGDVNVEDDCVGLGRGLELVRERVVEGCPDLGSAFGKFFVGCFEVELRAETVGRDFVLALDLINRIFESNLNKLSFH
jgi:hypothetical protein